MQKMRSCIDHTRSEEENTLKLDDLENLERQVLLGSILGDGCIKTNGSGKKDGKKYKPRHYCFYEGHAVVQAEYVKWKAKVLGRFGCRFMEKSSSTLSKSHPLLTKIHETVYGDKNHKNCFPYELCSKLDLLGLLIWYLDDGYLGVPKSGLVGKKKLKKKPAISIAFTLFDTTQLQVIVNLLNQKYCLSMWILQNKKCNFIKVGSNDRKFILSTWRALAKLHQLPKCMYYKLNMHNNFLENIESMDLRKKGICK